MAWSASLSSISARSSGGGTFSTGVWDTTGANFLLAAVSSYTDGAEPAITDDDGNTWVPLTAYSLAGVARIHLFYSVPTTVGAGNFINITGGGAYGAVQAAAFSGGHASAPADGVENGATIVSQPGIATGSITPTQDNCLIVTGLAWDGTGTGPTLDEGMTVIGYLDYVGANAFGVALGYKIQTTAAAISPTWTFTSNSASNSTTITAFRAAAGGGGTPAKQLLTLGVG